MTIYDLTQAIKRYRMPVIIASVVLILLVLVMTFQFKDGGIAFRSSLDYESSVQIAVVSSGTDSLIASDGSGQDLTGAADLYASLLSSAEAAEWIAAANGFDPIDTVDAGTASRSTVINATVLAPSADQARAAALSTFDWLNMKLTEPVTTSDFPTPTTTIAPIVFNGPVQSQINVDVDGELDGTSEDLFLRVEPDSSLPFTFSISQNAGAVVRSGAIVDPLMTLLVSLVSGSDEVLDTVRVAPPAAPRTVDAPPELGMAVLEGLITRTTAEVDGTTLTLDTDAIVLEWQDGVIPAEPEESTVIAVELALLTAEPGVSTSGGRRGPILAVSAILIGFILILATVIVADTWRRERDAQLASTTGAAGVAADGSHMSSPATSGGAPSGASDEGAPKGRAQPEAESGRRAAGKEA